MTPALQASSSLGRKRRNKGSSQLERRADVLQSLCSHEDHKQLTALSLAWALAKSDFELLTNQLLIQRGRTNVDRYKSVSGKAIRGGLWI
jgi:hypothetical protein